MKNNMLILKAKKVIAVRSFPLSKVNSYILFGIICIIYFLISYLSNTFIFTDQFYFRSLSDQFSYHTIQNLLNTQQQYWWLGYIITPLLVSLKVFFTAICVSIGAVLSTINFKFKTIFKATLMAEVVFIVAQVLYLINISFHLGTVTLATAANYYPLTILSIYGTQNVVDWLQYPLQMLNLFEVFYILAIAWLLSKQWKEDFMENMVIVLPSYITGLVLWLVLVTFLTLQIS